MGYSWRIFKEKYTFAFVIYGSLIFDSKHESGMVSSDKRKC